MSAFWRFGKIEGKRIYLREVLVSDANEGSNYHKWMNDPEVMKFLESRFQSWSGEQLSNYVLSMQRNPVIVFLAICLRDVDKHIGNIKLGPINWIHRFADIALVIDKPYWNKGYGTEAIQLLSDYAFNTLNLHKVVAGCYEENDGAIRAFKKAGFEEEGRLKEQYLFEGYFWRGGFIFSCCSGYYN